MKSKRQNLFLIATISLTFTAPSAFAASSTWDGSETNANWSTALNWGSGAPGDTASTINTDIATFNAAIANTWGSTALIPVIVDANRNIGGLNFNLAAGNFFIGSTAGNALLLSSGGTTQVNSTMTNGTFAGTINAPLVIQGASGTYSFTQNNAVASNTSTLTIGGGITGGAAGNTVITLNGTNTNVNTISGIIGNGSATTMAVTKTGAGTWIISGANTYNGDTTVTAGQLRGYVTGTSLTPISPFGASTIKLNGGLLGVRASGTLNTTAETVTFGNNVVVGASAIIDVNRPGITSTNKNMSMGTLSVGAFTLGVTSGSTYGLTFGATTLTGNATFNPSTSTATILTLGAVGQDIAGRTLTKTGLGVLTLGAVNTYTGATTVSAGTLTLNFAAGSNRINNGNAMVLSGGTLNYLTLGTNTQTFGSTTLTSGSTSLITRGTGYTSGVSDLGTLSGTGALDVNNLAAGTTWIKASGNPSQAFLLNGSVTANSGASLVQTDLNGNLQTVATTDYQNTVSIGNSPGVSVRLISTGLATPLTTGASTGFVGLSDAGTTDFATLQNNYTSGTSTIDVTFGGAANILRMGATGVITSSTGAALTIGTAAGVNANVGVLTAGGAANTAGGLFLNNAQAVTINSAINDNGTGIVSLSKNGAGTVTLSGTNSYTGATTINGGTLSITSSTALGTTAGATTINGGNGATGNTLNLIAATADLTIAENINFAGNTVGRARMANGSNFNYTFTGAIDVTSDTNIPEWNSGGAAVTGSITVSGNITGNFTNMAGSGLLIRGNAHTDPLLNPTNRITGNVTLTGGGIIKTDTNTWLIGASGKTYNAPALGVANGILKMGVANYLAAGVALTMGNATGGSTGTLDLNGFSQTVASIFYSGAGVSTGNRPITNSDLVNAATLTVDNATDNPSLGTSVTTNNVVLTGNLGLTKIGAGKLVLPGANTYTGATLISSGSLELGTGASSTTGSLTATTSITNNGNLTINRNDAFSQATGLGAGVAITGSGSFTQAGTGTTTLTNASNTYTGDTTISAGTLSVGLTGHLGAAAADLVFDGGTLQITGTTLVNFSTIGHPVSFIAAKTVGIDINNAAHTFTADQILNQTSGGLTKTGAGTLVLDQTNTYSGTTSISAGTLKLANTGALGTSSLVSIGANTLQIATSSPLSGPALSIAGGTIVSDRATPGVGFTHVFTGNLNASHATHNFTAGANVTGGTAAIQVASMSCASGSGGSATFNPTTANLIITGNATGANTGTSTFNLGGTSQGNAIGGAIENGTRTTQNVIKSGSSTWTLSGANTYNGTTAVNAGTLFVNGDQSLATGAVNVAANATLGGTGTLGGTTTIADTGKLAFNLSTAPGSHDKLELASGKTLAFTGSSTLTITSSGGATTGLYKLVTALGGITNITGLIPATVNLPVGWTADPPQIVADGLNTTLQINITSTGGSNYASWIASFGLTGLNALATADPDNDGIANGVEMVIGGNPATGMDTALLPTLELVTNPVSTPVIPPGNYLLFTYRRTAVSKSALVAAACETDTDLVAPWTPAINGTSGVVIQEDTNFSFTPAAPADTDRVRVYVPRGANTTLFGRLNVVVP